MRRLLAIAVLGGAVTACAILSGADELYVEPSTDGGVVSSSGASSGTTSSSGASSGVPPLVGYPGAVMQDDPSSYWRFAETSGTTAKDERNDEDGKIVGTVGYGVEGATKDGNRAFAFGPIDGGTPGYVDVGSNFDVDHPATFEAWLQADPVPGGATSANTSGERHAFSNLVKGSSGIQIALVSSPVTADGGPTVAQLVATMCGGSDTCDEVRTSIGTLPTAYLHVVVLREAKSIALFVDGTERDRASIGTRPRGTTTSLRIGAGYVSADRAWLGRIDEVAIYDHPLSDDRIKAHFAAR